jgi:hypothetical protein
VDNNGLRRAYRRRCHRTKVEIVLYRGLNLLGNLRESSRKGFAGGTVRAYGTMADMKAVAVFVASAMDRESGRK